MDKTLRKKSKEELEALLKYCEGAKENITNILKNAKSVYDLLIEKYESIKKELEERNE